MLSYIQQKIIYKDVIGKYFVYEQYENPLLDASFTRMILEPFSEEIL